MRKYAVLALFVILVLAISGCQATSVKTPTVEITFHMNPIPIGEDWIDSCTTIFITNPSQSESYSDIYIKFIDIYSQGKIIHEEVEDENPLYLYPGYQEELVFDCRYPNLQPGYNTLVVQLITPGPDGIIATSDDVVLAEDQAAYELI
ncbi:MAG: hypothetical protein KBH15_01705 [Candidatus Atribacteria bacterium]|nr:hypothetical protein [Candidatus Atribacteria bacterium]